MLALTSLVRNFKLDICKLADPEGGERAVITLDGNTADKTVLDVPRGDSR